jgi:sulfur carrier protein
VILVNGEPREVSAPTVAGLLDELGVQAQRGVAVAVNAEVVPRAEWERFEVPEAAKVEILTAMQGG